MNQFQKTVSPFKRWRKTLALASCFSSISFNAFAEDIFWFDKKEVVEQVQELDTVSDLIATVSTTWEIAAVSPTWLDITSQLELSKKAIEGKNWPLAKTLLRLLEGGSEQEWAFYAQGLVYSQTGEYTQAYQFLQNIDNPTSPFYSKTQIYKNGVALRLAESLQKAGQLHQAAEWLRRVDESYGDEETRHYYNRLIQKQNTNADTPKFTRPLRVSLLLPLSGPLSDIGQSMLKAAQMAMFDHAPRAILLYPQDTAGTQQGAGIAINRALKDRTDVVLGPLLAENTNHIAYIAENQRMPIISFSSDQRTAGRNTFLISHIPAQQARAAARLAAKYGKRKVAALIPNNFYGQETFRAFADEIKKFDGEIVIHSQFDPQSTDYSQPLESLVNIPEAKRVLAAKISELQKEYDLLGSSMDDVRLNELKDLKKSAPTPIIEFDSLFIPAPGALMPLIASQLAFYDVESQKVLFLGTTQWNDQKIFTNRAEYLRGGRFAAPNKAQSQRFIEEYASTYNEKPHNLAPLAYDAVKVVSELLSENPQSVLYLHQNLSREEGFNGYSGAFRFNSNGLPERAYDTLRIQSRNFAVEESSPAVMPPKMPSPLDPRDSEDEFFKFW